MTTLSRSRLLGATCLVLFILLLWLYPLLTLRLGHNQNDITTHLRWAAQFVDALRDGWLLPRWAYASLNGLGDPTFVYYQPLFYYISSAFALLGLRSGHALLLAAVVPYLLLGGIVYRLFLGRYRGRYAVLGAMLVVGCPLLYFLSTHVAAFPWTLSLPFSVLFVAESTRDRPRPLRLAVLLCLVCLSHLLSAMMTLCCTALARLIFAFPARRTIASHVNWGSGVALGFALAAFFLYPALSQLHLINPDGWDDPGGLWRKAFVFPTFTYASYGLRWFAIQWPLGLVALATAVMTLIPLHRAPATPAQGHARRLAMVSLAALALSTELAFPLYTILPPLQSLQFPYRFIFLAIILANIALAIHLNEGAWSRWGKLARTAAALVIAAQCAQAAFLQWNLVRAGERLPERASFMSGRFGQPEYHPAVRGPHWQAYAADGKLAGECRRLAIRCAAIEQRTHDFSVVIDTQRAINVRLPVFAYPGWRVSVDGQVQANLVADKETGLILVSLPQGRHVVALTWSGTPADITGLWISGGALCILLGALAISSLRQRRAGRQSKVAN
jgi:hypothetical protein